MRSARSSLAFFVVAYLPLTACFGLVAGSFQAPGVERSFSYELFLWFVVTVQLIVPTLVSFLITLLFFKLLTRPLSTVSATIRKVLLVAAVAVVLPVTQAFRWDGLHLSIDWFLVAVVPAGILGLMVGWSNRDGQLEAEVW